MQLIKNVRFIVLILLLLLSVYFLFSPLIFKKSGVVVTFASKDNKCGQIKEGDVITQAGGFLIGNSEDFENALQGVKSGEYLTMVINNGPGGCTAIDDGDVGISVANIPSNQLKFGIDIQGGTTTLLKPGSLSLADTERIEEIIDKRIVVFGLPETRVSSSNNFVKVTSLTTEKIGSLIMPGKFEAKIEEERILENNVSTIMLTEEYTIKVVDEKLYVNDSYYQINQSFVLEDVKFDLMDITNTSVIIEANVFDNEDMRDVLGAFGYVTYNSDFKNYQFNIQVGISDKVSNRFMKITKGLKTSFSGTQAILEGSLVYYLDGNLINELNIPFEMVGQKIENIVVIGSGMSRSDVDNQRLRIIAALKSGVLSNIEIVGTEKFEPKLKYTITELPIIIMMGLTIFIISLTYLRYKKIKFGLYALLLMGAEVFCVLGAAALTQSVSPSGWIIDVPSIVGLIVLAVMSFVQMFLMIEQKIKGRDISIYFKYKKFLSSSSLLRILVFIISFLILFSVWRGFGFSIIVGLIIGMFITKPIYNSFLEI